MAKCPFTWRAPYLKAPTFPDGEPEKTTMEQKCSLEKGHAGDHRSWSNVTAANSNEP